MGYILYIIDGERTPRSGQAERPFFHHQSNTPLINEPRPLGPDPWTVVHGQNHLRVLNPNPIKREGTTLSYSQSLSTTSVQAQQEQNSGPSTSKLVQ